MSASAQNRQNISISSIKEKCQRGEKLVMITAYDYPSAKSVEAAGVDMVLVGDSAAQVVLGYSSTKTISLDEMIMLAKAVRRGLQRTPMIVDLPFGSFEESNAQAVATAVRIVKETAADAVKLEGGGSLAQNRARAIIDAGIPLMGHIGLTPQTATNFAVQGKDVQSALRIVAEAKFLEEIGIFAIVLEAIPAVLSKEIVAHVNVITIGIGAGSDTTGQVLVYHDLLGIGSEHVAKFVHRYGQVQEEVDSALAAYVSDVRTSKFPAVENCYTMHETIATELHRALNEIKIDRI